MSLSACQTVAGFVPEIFSSAAIMSRSRFDPGKTTTAAFILFVCPLDELNAVILDDHIGEELLGHVPELGRGARRVVLADLDLEDLALADAFDGREAERAERALDRLALRVEDAGLQ